MDAPPHARARVILWDFGAKANMRRELLRRGCEVITVPHDTSAETIRSLNPDGILLSNGPGDPAENACVIRELVKVFHTGIPLFGICLGHQLMALARGGRTSKLTYGHRGGNHPARDLATGRVYITSQNHGYAVDTLPKDALARYENINDGTNEGIDYLGVPAFSVQFHPEAVAGPLEPNILFDRFMGMILQRRRGAAERQSAG